MNLYTFIDGYADVNKIHIVLRGMYGGIYVEEHDAYTGSKISVLDTRIIYDEYLGQDIDLEEVELETVSVHKGILTVYGFM